MPRGPKQEKRKGVWDKEFHGFVPCSLNDEQKKSFHEWVKSVDPESALGKVHSLIDHNYKFSWSLGGQNSSPIATLTCNDPFNDDCGWALSGFGEDYWQALYVVLFKHTIILQEHWTANGKPTGKSSGIG